MPRIRGLLREGSFFDNKSPAPPSVQVTDNLSIIFTNIPPARQCSHRPTLDDMTLINKYCVHGDVSAAAELLRRYERGLYNFLWQTVRHHQDAEDAKQETICKALGALPQFRQQCRFKTWLYRIGHNEAINIVRRRKRLEIHESPERCLDAPSETDMNATPSEQLVQNERVSALQDAIAKLPVQERQVVLLRMQEEMPFKEIARVIDAPLGTVLGRMRNARQRLNTLLSRSFAV